MHDIINNRDEEVYKEFREQLGRGKEGWYETNIIWKPNSPALPTNQHKKLKKDPVLFERYDKVIRDQLEEGIIEKMDTTESDQKTNVKEL